MKERNEKMSRKCRKQINLDVLIIDNMPVQAKSLQSELEIGQLKVVSHIVNIPSGDNKNRQIPQGTIDKVFYIIEKYEPKIILVDVCLDESVFDTSAEKRATWTGPYLMSEIRKCFANQKMASYSAYSRYLKSVDEDIEDQRKAYGVEDTPHWNATKINSDLIKSILN